MARIFEALQRYEGVAGSTAVEEAVKEVITMKPAKTFTEYRDDDDERCKEELLTHLNRFTPMKQPMKLGEKVANFFKVTRR